MRPSSHGVTAVFAVPFHTERNEAVNSWDNGRVWSSSSTYRRKRDRKVVEERPRLEFLYIPSETRLLSHGITAVFGVPLYTDQRKRPR